LYLPGGLGRRYPAQVLASKMRRIESKDCISASVDVSYCNLEEILRKSVPVRYLLVYEGTMKWQSGPIYCATRV
jgi:hypothetical protein